MPGGGNTASVLALLTGVDGSGLNFEDISPGGGLRKEGEFDVASTTLESDIAPPSLGRDL